MLTSLHYFSSCLRSRNFFFSPPHLWLFMLKFTVDPSRPVSLPTYSGRWGVCVAPWAQDRSCTSVPASLHPVRRRPFLPAMRGWVRAAAVPLEWFSQDHLFRVSGTGLFLVSPVCRLQSGGRSRPTCVLWFVVLPSCLAAPAFCRFWTWTWWWPPQLGTSWLSVQNHLVFPCLFCCFFMHLLPSDPSSCYSHNKPHVSACVINMLLLLA